MIVALILHLETASPTCSVALSENGQLLAIREQTAQNIHARVITLYIETVMKEAGKQLEELDAVCVSKGPGSYTGLRIGVSTAKGLCYALDKPLIAVNTLEAMASGLLRRHGTPPGTGLCPMLDARRMEVFMAVYRKGPTGIECESEPQAIVLDETTLDPWLADGHGLLLFGTGAEKCRPLYENRPEIKIMDDFKQSAAHLIEPAERSYSQRRFEDVAYFEPFYLKDFISTSPRAKN